MKSAPILKTERLVLRGIDEADSNYIVALRSKQDIYKYFFHPHKITVREHMEWFQNRYIWDENRLDWIAVEKIDRKPVGVFGVKREVRNLTVAEVSYLLALEFYGNGYASEAVRCVMAFAKEKWSSRSCIAEIHVENHASIRLAEKLGFEILGVHGSFIQYGRAL